MFSGKIPDWMVQIPAASVEADQGVQELAAGALPAGGGVDVDGVLDHPGVDAPVGHRRDRDPAGDAVPG